MASEYMELIMYNRDGRKCKVATGPWPEIRKKMEGAGKNVRRMANDAGNVNALPHLVLLFGLTAWVALMSTVLPYC